MKALLVLKPHEKLMAQFLLLAWALVVILPLAMLLINSFKGSAAEVYLNPFALPQSFNFENYGQVWQLSNFDVYFINSLIISFGTTFLVLLCASSTAFVLSKSNLKIRFVVFFCLLLGIVVPLRLALAPLVTIVRNFELMDDLLGVILVQSASMMPVAVFVMMTFFRSIPKEVEQAARMDGALPFHTYFYVMLPLVKPGLITVALLTFVQTWNEYFIPFVFLQDRELYPLTVGITEFHKSFVVQWQLIATGILMMLFPAIFIFFIASKQFILGVTTRSGV